MDKKENFQSYSIECLDNQNQLIGATINLWEKSIENPTINDIVDSITYQLEGTYNIFFIEYEDKNGNYFVNSSNRVSDAFYGLVKKAESAHIKMKIKGCRLGTFMIPRLQHSVYTAPLELGVRIDENFSKLFIFEQEKDVNTIATLQDLFKYYDKWLKSIEDVPY